MNGVGPRASRALAALMTLTIAAATGCGSRGDANAYSGTVQADSASVGSTAGGRVAVVLAQDGERVAKGEVLVRFDDRQQRAAYDAAVAQRDQADATLRDLEAGPRQSEIDKAAGTAAQADAAYRQAQLDMPAQLAAARQTARSAHADLIAAQAAAAKAERDQSRSQQLYDQGAIPAQQLDAARSTATAAMSAQASAAARLKAAQSALQAALRGSTAETVASAAGAAAAADANLDLVRAGARPDQIAAARAARDAAIANVAAAAARLDDAHVHAPADGVVDQLDLHPGDLVNPGAPVATIDESGDPWVRIYVTQSDMQHVHVGDAVTVRSDALGGQQFSGRVEAIDTRAQFTPRDVQTASDRADLTIGVKVRIHDPNHQLRAGTTVEVSLS